MKCAICGREDAPLMTIWKFAVCEDCEQKILQSDPSEDEGYSELVEALKKAMFG